MEFRIWHFAQRFRAPPLVHTFTSADHLIVTELNYETRKQFFSVQPVCSLCLCGFLFASKITTETQRTQRLHRDDPALSYLVFTNCCHCSNENQRISHRETSFTLRRARDEVCESRVSEQAGTRHQQCERSQQSESAASGFLRLLRLAFVRAWPLDAGAAVKDVSEPPGVGPDTCCARCESHRGKHSR